MHEDIFDKPLEQGIAIIKKFAANLSLRPGVYRMINEHDDVLYVGKAKALQKRVLSYTQPQRLSGRIQRMVAQTRTMEFIETASEAEALLLEANLIKKLKPKYNILLRDDKSFPYIKITNTHDFPLLEKHRGVQEKNIEYFGPFANAGAVNHTIAFLQKAFLLRNCSDNVFANRSRPCLQYHIKRCTAPCVDKVSKDEYDLQVSHARSFLNGESKKVLSEMSQLMHNASEGMAFEKAAEYRDRIKALNAIQAHQDINYAGLGNVDIFAAVLHENKCCVQVFFFRSGQNFGNKSYFPRHSKDATPPDILSAFIAQFYLNHPVPQQVMVNAKLHEEEHALLQEALTVQRGKRAKITTPERGVKRQIIAFAEKNALETMKRKIMMNENDKAHLEKLAQIFQLDTPPERIEVYDNSHTSGTNMIGAMICATTEGFDKNSYRKYNIKRSAASDDFAMMHEVISRRFKSYHQQSDVQKQDKDLWPDLLLIDGGKGQLGAVINALEELGIFEDDVAVVAISKGPDRNAGREEFHSTKFPSFTLPHADGVMHYLQRLRDESHRYAIGTHRAKRGKSMQKSMLDEIEGIGAARKKALLTFFGSAGAVANANMTDLTKVDGISKKVAETIYSHFHDQ
jgi:excinuclease ABC subunit C|tara:strand:+ start:279606 stop:281486 length:1881 start_codon:yes stop_codon:yes gene_type:complete